VVPKKKKDPEGVKKKSTKLMDVICCDVSLSTKQAARSTNRHQVEAVCKI
jgi:hypothetical protein